MTKVFEQKRGFTHRKYTLLSDHLLVEIKTIGKNQKFELKLDRIGHDILYQSDSNILAKIFSYVCLAFPVLLWIAFLASDEKDQIGMAIVMTIVFWGIASVNIFKKRKDDIYITGGQINLIFFRTLPSEEKVLSFVNEIIAASKAYIKGKYGTVNVNLPEDEFLRRLNWLKEKEIIDEAELNELREEYKTKKLLS